MNYTKHPKNLASFRFLYFALALCLILIAALANSHAPARAALNSPSPSYDGRVDRGDCSWIGGYALDENTPTVPINVDIFDGATLLASIPANQFRRDLFDAGMDPYHGFLFSVPTSVKNGKIHTIYVRFGGTGIDVPDSPRFIACKASLFPTATPVTTASGQGATWEQGVEFSSSMDGIIKQVRFWRAAEEPVGGHVGRIWNASTGALLASASFNEVMEPGWQYATVNFPITAGVRYRVTYNINYVVAKTFNVFNNGPITKGPLTGWLSYYGTPAGQFPTSASTSNLFADVVFDAPR